MKTKGLKCEICGRPLTGKQQKHCAESVSDCKQKVRTAASKRHYDKNREAILAAQRGGGAVRSKSIRQSVCVCGKTFRPQYKGQLGCTRGCERKAGINTA